MNHFVRKYPIKIDLVYAKSEHPDNHFPGLYQPEAKLLWAHKAIAEVTLLAALYAQQLRGWTLQLNDCLRPVEAQEQMAVYGHHPAMVSVPGSGGHPRAMAIDVEPLDIDGENVHMGTPFDFLVKDPIKMPNPAARNYVNFDVSTTNAAAIWDHRATLEFCMQRAASDLGRKFLSLPQEWWDFRFPKPIFEKFKPLREADLHPYQRLTVEAHGADEILQRRYPTAMKLVLAEVEAVVLGVIGTPAEPARYRRRRLTAPAT